MITCKFENGKIANLRHVVADALIVEKGKILLVKRAPHLDQGNKYALPGGFLNRNEFINEAIVREVKEETGYLVKTVSLFWIVDNPDRGEDRQNVAFVYIIKPVKKVGEPDNETSEVKWFDLTKLPDKKYIAFDHYRIIQKYLAHLRKPFSLPVFG